MATARAELAALIVAAPRSTAGYARVTFTIRVAQPDGCTTCQAVRARDGTDVKDKTDHCQPASNS